ncbi:MAG TPA: metallophosphoesterase family protein [Burkholderiaceae bacterium]|nr:metallophosphoesterase family protein [Burkholderiaceae bacterium]
MRIAAISDIHGNAHALRAVLADARRQGFDVLCQIGDAFSGPLWPRETAEILRGLDAIHVRGNHDVSLVDPGTYAPGRADRFALAELDAATLDWIRGWPRTRAVGDEVLLFHGAPHHEDFYLLEEAPSGDPRLRPVADVERDLGGVRARVMVCGHSHTPRVVELSDGTLVVNDGSVGLPAYEEPLNGTQAFVQSGSPHAQYAIVDVTPGEVSVTLRRVAYDWREASAKAAAEGFGAWARWLSGRSRG